MKIYESHSHIVLLVVVVVVVVVVVLNGARVVCVVESGFGFQGSHADASG